MSRLPLLLLAGLTGCYPYLTEDWYDYVEVPDNVGIVGESLVVDPAGGYWEDGGAAYGITWFGWLDEPESDLGAVSALYGSEGCQQAPSWSPLFNSFADVGGDKARAIGPAGPVALEWDADNDRYYGRNDKEALPVVAGAEAEYYLEPVDIDGDEVSVERFFTIPRPLDFDGPSISGNDIADLKRSEMAWTWNPADAVEGALVVFVIEAVDTSFDTEETVTCVIDAREGELEVDTDLWNRPNQHNGWFVRMSTVVQTDFVIDGVNDDIASTMASQYARLGFFYKE